MSTTPPTSPPPSMAEAMGQPGEKRSHEQMNENAATADVQIVEKPVSSATLPQPPRSTSPLGPGRRSPGKTSFRPDSSPQRPVKGDPRRQPRARGGSSFTHSSEDSTHLESHPKHPIEPFDWDEFEERFADAMGKIKEKEDLLYDEFNDMIQFFGTWLSTIDNHENERAYKR
ncbi:hypothetical protein GP486_003199 [Trichoglossum hirsutum]|uniref:Uncharacterized protein n=1 Tax=Trichoglossum hirsutum TaxID=265104 RepID=A0A9P8LDL8_9PEZI|nr:hypothetical protein GP486_003199 [Trichoglossum hirsutum]